MILCLTGMPGSGKSTAARIFSRKGFEVMEMSGIIKEEMRRLKIRVNPESVEEFVNKEKAERGKDVFAVMMGKRLRGLGHNVLVIGFRSVAEFETVERAVGMKLPLIAISSPEKLRFRRLSGRRTLPVKSPEKFRMRERSNIRMGILEVLARADYLVANTGTRKEFDESIEELIRRIAETE